MRYDTTASFWPQAPAAGARLRPVSLGQVSLSRVSLSQVRASALQHE
jgi:hypothetical protein